MEKKSLRLFSHLFFDLDGTLTESAPGIVNSVRFALNHFGIREDDDKKLLKFIGPPLMDSFRDFYGFSEERARKAMEIYRIRFGETGLFENSVYDGIPQVLSKLRESGKKLYVATSNPAVYMEKILEKFDLARFFDGATGSDLSENNSAKSVIIKKAILSANLQNEAENGKIAMIGDRFHDVLGAKANKIPALGCLWGYGSREELAESGADWIFERVCDLEMLI